MSITSRVDPVNAVIAFGPNLFEHSLKLIGELHITIIFLRLGPMNHNVLNAERPHLQHRVGCFFPGLGAEVAPDLIGDVNREPIAQSGLKNTTDLRQVEPGVKPEPRPTRQEKSATGIPSG